MPFRSYSAFVQYHKMRMVVLLALPFMLFTAWCVLIALMIGDVRYPVSLWVILILFTVLKTITPSDSTPTPMYATPKGSRGMPTHALDVVVQKLRDKNLLNASCLVHLDRDTLGVPCIYVRGLESAHIILSHHDRPLWRTGVPEAIIMHEVGHVHSFIARIAALKPARTLSLLLQMTCIAHGVTLIAMLLVVTIPFVMAAVTCISISCALLTVVLCKCVEQPLNHSAEFVADSHIVHTCGVEGVRGLLRYFEDGLHAYKNKADGIAISPYAKDTHPAVIERIKALHLFVRGYIANTQPCPRTQPTHP